MSFFFSIETFFERDERKGVNCISHKDDINLYSLSLSLAHSLQVFTPKDAVIHPLSSLPLRNTTGLQLQSICILCKLCLSLRTQLLYMPPVARVLNEPLSQLIPLSGVAAQARQFT
jgi:hypothetical protein